MRRRGRSPVPRWGLRLNDYGPVGRRRDSGAVEQVAGICGRVDDAAKVVMKSFNRALGRTNEFAFASALCSLAKASRYHFNTVVEFDKKCHG
jgi:hypothetical protein